MTYRIAFPLLALLGAVGCRGSAVTDPISAPAGARDATVGAAPSAERSGALHVEKDCRGYNLAANGTCTITKSNVQAIEVGSTITYLTAAPADFMLNTDIVLDPPGPGNNHAFGHCTVNLGTGFGQCELSAGTGKFIHIHASVAVTPCTTSTCSIPPEVQPAGFFAWDGTYSYSN